MSGVTERRLFPDNYRSNSNLREVLVGVFSELRDVETFLHVDLKRQQIIDVTIDHLCNREISPVKLFFCFSGKLKYLVLLDQILEYDSNV